MTRPLQLAASLALLLSAFGCAPIQHTSATEQALDTPLLAGIGDIILRINKERNLQNAFGASDIFGRKTNEGFVEIRFAGVERSGEVVLARKDVQIISNETTMSRTPLSYTAGQAQTAGTARTHNSGAATTISGTASTTFQSATIAPLSDYHVVVPSDSLAIRLPPTETELPVEGYIIEIVSSAPYSLKYKVRRQ
jgi:hypothetical protein